MVIGPKAMSAFRVCIVGTGYVGLTNAVALAYLGNQVTCLDVEAAKIASLSAGKIPIFEPHLDELLAAARSRLTFTTSYADAIPSCGHRVHRGGHAHRRRWSTRSSLPRVCRTRGRREPRRRLYGHRQQVDRSDRQRQLGRLPGEGCVRGQVQDFVRWSLCGRIRTRIFCARAPLCTTRSTPIAR